MLANTLITHFWEFFFVPTEPHTPWYHGQVWGNVVAVLPLAILGAGAFAYHHFVVKGLHDELLRKHDEHSEHLRKIIEALDPETESDSTLDLIADRVDDGTPGGIGVLRERIDELKRAGQAQLPSQRPAQRDPKEKR